MAINKTGMRFVPVFVCITFALYLHCICKGLQKPLGATALNAQKLQHIFAHIDTKVVSCNGIFLSY